jgi:hypothetical protein
MKLMRQLMWSAALAALALPAGPARAERVEPPRPPVSALGKIRDLAATVRARRALQEDPALATLNLGVQVDNGVVSVWGPVPSRDVERQAVARLEAVKGVIEVRPRFYLDQPRDAAPLIDLARPVGAPERVSAKPGIETGQLPAATVGRDQPRDDGPRLFAPRPASARPEAAAAVVKLPRPAAPLAEQVRQAQLSEKRFGGIAVELRGTAVLVRRGEAPGRDLMDLVGKLRRIEGISDVILSD